jgi:hypothetical protein
VRLKKKGIEIANKRFLIIILCFEIKIKMKLICNTRSTWRATANQYKRKTKSGQKEIISYLTYYGCFKFFRQSYLNMQTLIDSIRVLVREEFIDLIRERYFVKKRTLKESRKDWKQRKRAEQSRAEQSRAEQSRAEQSRAEQSRAEQSTAQHSRVTV